LLQKLKVLIFLTNGKNFDKRALEHLQQIVY
jgi:hypothetical protein